MTKAQLEQLEKLAGLFYTISQCAIILEVDGKKLRKAILDPETEESKKYNRGFLLSDKEVREKMIEMASRGSTKAQAMVMELITNVRLDNEEEEQ